MKRTKLQKSEPTSAHAKRIASSRDVDAIEKEIKDVKIVMMSDQREYWHRYLKDLEDELVETILLLDLEDEDE